MENEINTLFWLGTCIMIAMALVVIAILLIYQKNIRSYHYKHLKQQLRAIIEAEYKERARIAKELHDGMCGDLATVQNFMAVLELTKDKEQRKSLITDIKQSLLECYNQCITLSYNLSPPLLRSSPLELIVKNYLNRLSKVINIEFKFTSNKSLFALNESVKLEIYRVLQELIQNIIKHSDALKVTVELEWKQDILIVRLQDNGREYKSAVNSQDLAKGTGLSNVRARVKQIDASFIHEHFTHGNIITITVPYYEY